MKFGVTVHTDVDSWELIKEAEEQGYDRAWVPDSQMIWGDCYVSLAMAAINTSRIRIGTGVTTPGTRIAPVTAHSIATINKLAPGRTFLGIGTAHTAMRLIGQPPISPKEMREYIHVVRTLLNGDEVAYTHRGRTAEIQFMQQDRKYTNLEDKIPIYVAANGPLALKATGELSEGWITAGKSEAEITGGLTQIKAAAAKVDRKLPSDFMACSLTSACVLRPGEKLTSERVINQTGSWVTTLLHFNYEIWEQFDRKEEMVLPEFRDVWEEYIQRVDSINLPPEARFRQVHEGHCTFLQETERRFVTPKTIKATCLVGEPDDIVDQLRKLERVGLNEVALLPPADYNRDIYRDFAEHVMPHFQ